MKMVSLSQCGWIGRIALLLCWLPMIATADPVDMTPPSVKPLSPVQQAICHHQQDVLRKSLSDLASPETVLRRAIAASNRVVLLGESHDTDALEYEPQLMALIRHINPKYECVYLEFTRLEDIPESDPYYALAQAAMKLGFKVHFIDHLKTVYPDDRYMNTTERNRAMAGEIAQSLKDGSCAGGIDVIGKAHLYSRLLGKEITSVPAFLGQSGIPNQAIDLISLDIEDVRLEPKLGEVYRYTPNNTEIFTPSCPIDAPNVESPEGFGKIDLPADIEYDPGVGGRFSDFAATILIP